MKMKTFVHLNKIKIFARHGVLPQEQLTGAYFYVSLRIGYDFSEAMQTDNLAGTISYADIFEIVRQEMAIPSKLLEHVGGRIVERIKSEFPQITSVELVIDKENPPMGAECSEAGIEIKIDY